MYQFVWHSVHKLYSFSKMFYWFNDFLSAGHVTLNNNKNHLQNIKSLKFPYRTWRTQDRSSKRQVCPKHQTLLYGEDTLDHFAELFLSRKIFSFRFSLISNNILLKTIYHFGLCEGMVQITERKDVIFLQF